MYKKKYLKAILLFSAIVPSIITSDAMSTDIAVMHDENANPNTGQEKIYGSKTTDLLTPKKKRVLGENNVGPTVIIQSPQNHTSEIDDRLSSIPPVLNTRPKSNINQIERTTYKIQQTKVLLAPIKRNNLVATSPSTIGDFYDSTWQFNRPMIPGMRITPTVVSSKIQTAHNDPAYKDPLQFVSLFIDKLFDVSIYNTSEIGKRELRNQFDTLLEYVDKLPTPKKDMVWGDENSKMKKLFEIHESQEDIDFNDDFNSEYNPVYTLTDYALELLYSDRKQDNFKKDFDGLCSYVETLDEENRMIIWSNPKFRSLFERYYGDETPDYSPQKQIRSDSDSDSDSDFNALGTREGWDYESERSIESFSEEEEGSRPHKSKPKTSSKTSTTTLYPEEDSPSSYYYGEEDYPETLEATASKESDSTAIEARPYTEESFSEEEEQGLEEESISHKPKPKAPSKTSTTTLYPEEDSPSSYYYGEEDYPETLETTASKESDSTAIEAQANIEESKSLALNDAIYSITESVIRNINSVNIYNNIAIAAGDNNPKAKRIWSRGFAAHSKQSGDNQFKVGSCGVSIGGDIDIIEDKFILGAVFTKAGTKAQILNSSDMKLTSNIWSIYTRYNIGDNFVMDGDVSYGLLKVKGLEKKGKNNNGDLFKASASISHKIRLNDNSIIVMPNFGMTYDHGSVKYKKSDIKYSNLSGNIGLSIGLAGLKLGNNVDITPSIHAGAKHIISQKKSNISISINYNSISAAPTYKSHKDIYNIGASMDIRRNHAVTLGVGYDCNFRKQYKSHSGFIKVEVKF